MTQPGKNKVFGNILSLINYTDNNNYIARFSRLFINNTSLIDATNFIIPFNKLNYHDCSYMFQDCTNLIYPPNILPATTINHSSYREMFNNCISLIKTPNIQLSKTCIGADFGCQGMFRNCTSLKYSIPILLPEDMGTSTAMYESMFTGCIALLQAPIINIQTFSTRCINYMFYNCKLLNKIEVNFTEWAMTLSNWVNGVSPSGTFICPSKLPEIRRL